MGYKETMDNGDRQMTSYPDKLRLCIYFKNGLTKTVDIGCYDRTEYWDQFRTDFHKSDSIHTKNFWFKTDEVIFVERI